MVERFVREAEVVNLLEHPNIAAIFELEKLEDGRPYCVMEHLSGITLDALLRAKGRLSPDEALDILAPVCEALHAAHDAGIVHRDVKPNNIMICGDGAARSVKLLDFGIAKLMARSARWRRSRSCARRSTPAPTCTRSASCSIGS
jgi:eukaryotic-like serine/threonine-protein kinase